MMEVARPLLKSHWNWFIYSTFVSGIVCSSLPEVLTSSKDLLAMFMSLMTVTPKVSNETDVQPARQETNPSSEHDHYNSPPPKSVSWEGVGMKQKNEINEHNCHNQLIGTINLSCTHQIQDYDLRAHKSTRWCDREGRCCVCASDILSFANVALCFLLLLPHTHSPDMTLLIIRKKNYFLCKFLLKKVNPQTRNEKK